MYIIHYNSNARKFQYVFGNLVLYFPLWHLKCNFCTPYLKKIEPRAISVDNHTFLYTVDDVMEIDQRLYELENILSDKDFVRISKSQIVNINKIQSLKPELNRTILATMCNNEKLSISRKYVKIIRNILPV